MLVLTRLTPSLNGLVMCGGETVSPSPPLPLHSAQTKRCFNYNISLQPLFSNKTLF